MVTRRKIIATWVGGCAIVGMVLAAAAYVSTRKVLPPLLVFLCSLLLGLAGGIATAVEWRDDHATLGEEPAGRPFRLPSKLRALSWLSLVFVGASMIAKSSDAPAFVTLGLLIPAVVAVIVVQLHKHREGDA